MSVINCLLLGLPHTGKSVYLSSIGQCISSFKGNSFPVYQITCDQQTFHVIESETCGVPCMSIKCVFYMSTGQTDTASMYMSMSTSTSDQTDDLLIQIKQHFSTVPLIVISHHVTGDSSIISIEHDPYAPFRYFMKLYKS